MTQAQLLSRQKVAVIGLGGIGGGMAGQLMLAGKHDVTICTRNPLDVMTFESGERAARLPLNTLADPAGASPVDWVILSTKAHDTGATAPWFARLCNSRTRVAVLQNGVEHEARVQPMCPTAEILPAIVYYNGERIRPDHFRMRRVTDYELAVPAGDLADAFSALLDGTEFRIFKSDDFKTMQWRKLLVNVVANPVTALTRQRLGVLHRDSIKELCLAVLDEAVEVGRAAGARFDENEAQRTLDTVLTYPGDAGTSMYFDCLASKPLEIEALTGAIVAAGKRFQVLTPLNSALLALLKAISDANENTVSSNVSV
ncbi:2-dehydropantoate 2-reductase [Rhizobiaceae bacterium n13]|uniref:2-dehydropantoate 2-reductase n=1 Tax=Ferirhizobium litorale TaxID=2927786 RepID=A0AAE3QI93_9HYPH|nr:2-dehydropantoate 2-reductase [Fererhizobium litorale]MDI7864067.1 2-dehydropantoate 2-reductase [Fererhizobium litorale]MDI7924450.1 2-dehydropantoate 2-reductase [Fererhizobium litorale]